MKFHKKCEGCNHKNLPCILKYNHDLVSKCPCCDCLIKMVCTKMCAERVELYESFMLFFDEEHNRIVYNLKRR